MFSEISGRGSVRRIGLATVMAMLAALTMGVALPAGGATNSIDFEAPAYAPGSIQGQDGWGGSGTPINPSYDQGVVSTSGFGSPAGFGAQTFRMSNAVTSGSFGDWVFSPSLADEAGETSAVSDGFSGGTRKTHFEASLDIASAVPNAEQPGLQISLSPDRGDGARMSFLRVRDEASGISITFADYQSGVNEPGCPTGDNFVETKVASGLDRSVPHSLRISMGFSDGPGNDVVGVFVDDDLVWVGTSWENFFRECEENATRPVDSLIFQSRSGGGTAPATSGKGFLIDNLSLKSFSSPFDPCLVSKSGTSPTIFTLLEDCTTNHTIVVPQRVGGTVFDGAGHSIKGVDSDDGPFLGAVVQGEAGTNDITVKNLEVTVDGLQDSCQDGAGRLRGILFDGVGGTIRDNTVTDIRQGAESGCQEGNGIEVRNEPFEKGGVDESVVIRDNVVTGYQKTGILANGSVSATIRGNEVHGEGGIDYIAQNGIQVGFAATARLFGNEASLNRYTPRKVTACGLLLFKADGVGGEFKNGLRYVREENDFHNNEQNICNFGKGGTFKPAT